MRSRLILLAAALGALPALAQVPSPHSTHPGHPTPADAGRMMGLPGPAAASALPNKGEVLQAIDANLYTYVEVRDRGAARWLAAPKTDMRPGAVVRFDEGLVMTNFYSKALQRTFPSILFVTNIAVVDEKP